MPGRCGRRSNIDGAHRARVETASPDTAIRLAQAHRRTMPGKTGYPHRKSPVPHQRPGFGRSDCRVEVTRPGFPLTTHSYRHSDPRMHNVVNRLLTDSSHHRAQVPLRLVAAGSAPHRSAFDASFSRSDPDDKTELARSKSRQPSFVEDPTRTRPESDIIIPICIIWTSVILHRPGLLPWRDRSEASAGTESPFTDPSTSLHTHR
jgi:hypothetical protein